MVRGMLLGRGRREGKEWNLFCSINDNLHCEGPSQVMPAFSITLISYLNSVSNLWLVSGATHCLYPLLLSITFFVQLFSVAAPCSPSCKVPAKLFIIFYPYPLCRPQYLQKNSTAIRSLLCWLVCSHSHSFLSPGCLVHCLQLHYLQQLWDKEHPLS